MRPTRSSLTLGLFVGGFAYAFLILAPTFGFAAELLHAGAYALAASLFGSTLITNTSLPASVLAALVGVNTGLIVYYIQQRRTAPSSSIAGGIAGGVAAIFGIGCAACGSTLAIALFGASSGTLVGALPYGGAWLGNAGLLILAFSAAFLVREIRKPLVCPT